MTHPLLSQVTYARVASGHASAFAALIWWVIPVVLVSVAIGYVVWTSKFKDKFHNETNRSVDKFNLFQQTLREPDSEH